MTWAEIYKQTTDAERPTPTSYRPIPPITISGVQPGKLVAIGITNDIYTRPRNLAFYLNTYVNKQDYGLPVNNSYPPMIALDSWSILLDKWTLVDLPPADYSYTVELVIPRWFQNITPVLWLNSTQP